MAEAEADALPPPTLESQFLGFSKLNAETGFQDGTTITIRQSDVWMEQAKVFNKNLTLTDTGREFFKLRKRNLDYSSYLAFLENLAYVKQIDLNELLLKLINCGIPGI